MKTYDVIVKRVLYYREIIEAETPDNAVDELIDQVEDEEADYLVLDLHPEAEPFKVTEVKPPEGE